MWKRPFWINRIEAAWQQTSVVWLSGVRRVGKTILCQSLEAVEYFDCELPRFRQLMQDPEGFLRSVQGKRIVLDEIHRLPNPSEFLKIAADHYPAVKIVATGSSTLGASIKFRDTLTGRKKDIFLTPIPLVELSDFQNEDLSHRALNGGLPAFFLADETPESDYQDWMDTFWAKDIQELFRLERRASFQRFIELLLIDSGGMFEATRFAALCEVSRTTIANYLAVLAATHIVHVIKPFSSRRSNEIVSAPKVYGFDTGFICYYKGWLDLRPENIGLMWEHLVLNEVKAQLPGMRIQYWRDKNRHEVDFVIANRGQPPTFIECKRTASKFDHRTLKLFRKRYPAGENYVVAMDVTRAFTRTYNDLIVNFTDLQKLIDQLR